MSQTVGGSIRRFGRPRFDGGVWELLLSGDTATTQNNGILILEGPQDQACKVENRHDYSGNEDQLIPRNSSKLLCPQERHPTHAGQGPDPRIAFQSIQAEAEEVLLARRYFQL